MSKSGDWMCSACQYENFKKREECGRCGYPKYNIEGGDPSKWTRVMPGDWFCTTCGAHNYASRPTCFKCLAFKTGYGCSSHLTSPPAWKPGDWICPSAGCGEHNYASRTECFRCKTPRD